MIRKLRSVLGFTFIESLIVIAVLGLVFPIVFSTLFIILRQQIKVYRLSEVKRQGDSIINYLDNVIKNNAFRIYDDRGEEMCDPNMDNPNPVRNIASFEDKYNSSFSIDYSSPNLSITYPTPLPPAPTFAFPQGTLNSSKVIISAYQATCQKQESYSAPIVFISFSVCYKDKGVCPTGRQEELASLDYTTYIKLRNFPVP